jgi:hypothetical protein
MVTRRHLFVLALAAVARPGVIAGQKKQEKTATVTLIIDGMT